MQYDYDFGASPGDLTVNSSPALQKEIDHLIDEGGGSFFLRNAPYRIDEPLSLGSNVQLIGKGPETEIIQFESDIPIVKIDKEALNFNWAIRDLRLSYNELQPAENTGAQAIVLSEANKISYLYDITNLLIYGAYNGISLPEATGCQSFLGDFRNLSVYQCSDYGVMIKGAASGANTNLHFDNVWVNNKSGEERTGSKGFDIRRVDGIEMTNCGCDHIQGLPFNFNTVRGRAGTLWAESCDLTASSGAASFLSITGSELDIALFYAVSNVIALTGSADCYLVYSNTGSEVRIGTVDDRLNDLTKDAGAYYTTNIDSTSLLSIDRFKYSAHATRPVPNANHADFAIEKRLRFFDGNERSSVRGGKLHTYGTVAPVSGTRAVGDIHWNTTTTTGGPLGWFCITAGSPGTWQPFGLGVP